MEMRFTASMVMAIKAAMDIHGGKLWVRPAEAEASRESYHHEGRVTWCNFMFFSRIHAGKIMKIERTDPRSESAGSWSLRREVEFYHLGEKVVVVSLIGRHYDQGRRNPDLKEYDNDSFWAVDKVEYLPSEGQPFVTVECHPASVTGLPIRY